ncbi:MAG: hypothetical protein KKD44_07160 [Proteobacteria bacterium]|nr:hypothetical protein [Pseudomonadota bacterium]
MINTRFRTIWIFLISVGIHLILFCGPSCCAEDMWEHVGTYDGVALFRSLEEKEGLLPFKAVAELDVAYDKIVMALVDAESKASWAPKLKATAIHAVPSSNSFEYSEYYETPWPFKDREFLLLGGVLYLDDRILFTAINSPHDNLARADHQLANIERLNFTIIPLSDHKTRVSFEFSGDLGGWIPDFVKNIIQKKWPVRFIQSLKDHIATHPVLETERYLALVKPPFAIPLHP